MKTAAELDTMAVWNPAAKTETGAILWPEWGQRFSYLQRERPHTIVCGQESTRYGCTMPLWPGVDTLFILPGHWIVCRQCRDRYLKEVKND